MEDLARWASRLTEAEISTTDMVAAIGEAQDGKERTKIRVRPRSADWDSAEVFQGSDAKGPDRVRLEPAAGSTLTASDLEHAFGPPETTPARMDSDQPEQRIYRIDSGQPGHTTALIAELRPRGGSVRSVVLRRDARPD